MVPKDIFNKKIGDLTVREYLDLDTFLIKRRNTDNSEWISVRKASELIGVTERWIHKMCQEGTLKSEKSGRRRLLKKSSVLEFIEHEAQRT